MANSHLFRISRSNHHFTLFSFSPCWMEVKWLLQFWKFRNQASLLFRGQHFSCRIERNENLGFREILTKTLDKNLLFWKFWLQRRMTFIYICVSAFGLCHSLTFSKSYIVFFFSSRSYHKLSVALTSQVRSWLMVEADQSSHVFMLRVYIKVHCRLPIADGYMSQNVTAPGYHLHCGKQSKARSYWTFLSF